MGRGQREEKKTQIIVDAINCRRPLGRCRYDCVGQVVISSPSCESKQKQALTRYERIRDMHTESLECTVDGSSVLKGSEKTGTRFSERMSFTMQTELTVNTNHVEQSQKFRQASSEVEDI